MHIPLKMDLRKRKQMKNKLTHLNDHLFAQIERLGDEGLTPEAIQREVGRTKAIVDISDQIIKNADTLLKAASLAKEIGARQVIPLVPMLETGKTA